MAAKGRRTSPPLIDELRNRPYRFDFYQAVRLIELMHGVGIDADSKKLPVGEGSNADREAVRFRSDPSLAFPPSSIKTYTPRDGEQPDDMEVRFMGLAGALGPLPRPFTERLIQRVSKKDTAWRAFLDMFNHRLASLMVRMRKAHRIGLDTRPPERTLTAKFLRAFIGIGAEGLQNRMAVEDRAILRYAGLFAHTNRSAAGLEQLLCDYFQLPFRVRQFVGEWVSLEDGQETRLGLREGQNNALGTHAFLGTRYWDQQSSFDIVVGPLDRADFESFLPGGSRFRAVRALVTFYATPEFNFSIRIHATPAAVPASRLGEDLRLGWTSWLRQAGATTADEQVRIRVRGHAALGSP